MDDNSAVKTSTDAIIFHIFVLEKVLFHLECLGSSIITECELSELRDFHQMMLQIVEFQRKLNVHSISKAKKCFNHKSADLKLQKTFFFQGLHCTKLFVLK